MSRREFHVQDDDSFEYESIERPLLDLWDGERRQWIFMRDPHEGDIWWIVATDQEGIRRAREVARSFIGPAAGRIRGPQEDVRITVPDGRSFDAIGLRVRVIDRTLFAAATERIAVVRTAAPRGLSEAPVHPAQLLRDFRLALQSKDIAGATDLLNRIVDAGQLSLENQRFLRVDLLASAEYWRALRQLEWFGRLSQVRRPARVSDAMAEAIWQVDFVADEKAEPPVALAHYEQLPSEFVALYDSVDVPSRRGARRLAALRAVHQGSNARLARIRAAGTKSDQVWIDALIVPADQTVELAPAARASKLFLQGRWVDTVEVAEAHPDDISVVMFAIHAIVELNESTVAARLLSGLASETRAFLAASEVIGDKFKRVEDLAADECASWLAWLERVAVDDRWDSALDVVLTDGGQWGVEELDSAGGVERFVAALDGALRGANRDAIEGALAPLCGVAAQLCGSPRTGGLVDAVLLQLLEYPPTVAVGDAFLGLVQASLRSNPSRDRYRTLVDVTLASDQLFVNRVLLNSALDLLDEFAAHPSPDQDYEMRLASRAYAGLKVLGAHGHLDATNAELAERLLSELGMGEVSLVAGPTTDVDEEDESDPWVQLSGKRVLLYSLLGGVGERFRKQLERRCPSVEVVVRQDHDAGQHLGEAVQAADFVIVDLRHAKHAATIAIDAVLARSSQILPEGRGVSSFLRALAAVLTSFASD